ncbi:MAG: stage III sporulation protein AF [Firmicutes bacterium]|nr:stage III sporulation protein AF [Bacillota bacterium]
MTALAQWIRGLVTFLLVSGLMLMLVPDTDLRKFVRMVVGLILIGLLMQPLIGGDVLRTAEQMASSLDRALDNENRELAGLSSQDLQMDGQRLIEKGSGVMREYMENQTNRQVGALLSLFAGINEAQVISQVNSKGELERVVVQLQLEPSVADEAPLDKTYLSSAEHFIDPIEPVVIVGGSLPAYIGDSNDVPPLVQRVQNWVAEFFDIDKNQVVVSVL